MSKLKEWLRDTEQQTMTHLVNRTCKRHPNLLDRLATRLLSRLLGAPDHDPDLDHPENSSP
ncbi:MAG: hypothetical protein AB8B93_15275 [Pseudomonadales bacterium]